MENDIFSDLDSLGIVNDIHATDIDNDGWKDLIIVGEWSNIEIIKNDKGRLERVTNDQGFKNLKGWWFSVSEIDINNDNLPDFVVGNVGENFKLKASTDKPLKDLVPPVRGDPFALVDDADPDPARIAFQQD